MLDYQSLTYWPLGKIATILKVSFSNSLYTGVAWPLAVKLLSGWIPQNLTNEKSKLVQVIAFCHQPTECYVSQCWPKSLSQDHNELNHMHYGSKKKTIVSKPKNSRCLSLDKLVSELILGLRPANERRRYFVTMSLIGWVRT